MLTYFHNSFAVTHNGNLARNSYLNIPPHIKCASALPCEIWQQCEIFILINDKSQSSTVWYLTCDELRHYNFIIEIAGKRIFLIVNIWGEVTRTWLTHVLHSPYTFVLRDAELAR